jgi:Fe-S-cluster-containing hydrogenase component 2
MLIYSVSKKLEEEIVVNKSLCIGCGACAAMCPVDAITFDSDGKAQINKEICIQCGACEMACPVSAIKIFN